MNQPTQGHHIGKASKILTTAHQARQMDAGYVAEVLFASSAMSLDRHHQGLALFRLCAIGEGCAMICLSGLSVFFGFLATAHIFVGVVALLFLLAGVAAWICNIGFSGRMGQVGRLICFLRLVVATLFIVAGGSLIKIVLTTADGCTPWFSESCRAASNTFLPIFIVIVVFQAIVAFFSHLAHTAEPRRAMFNPLNLSVLLLSVLSLMYEPIFIFLGPLVGVRFLFNAFTASR